MSKEKIKEEKTAVKKGSSKEERYVEDGEDKIKTTYPDGTVIVSTM